MCLGLAALAGCLLGWFARGRQAARLESDLHARAAAEQNAAHAEQLRLTARNRRLLGRLATLQASEKDAVHRAEELAAALKGAFRRRDDLQRALVASRAELAEAQLERERLKSDLRTAGDREARHARAIAERDRVIFRLSRELEGWQDRLPPLIRRFTDQNDEVARLESALEEANERILALEAAQLAAREAVEGRRAPGLTLYAGNGAGAADGADDLQAIKGVGPAIEKTLHALGIFSYSQVAGMTEYDINRVAERLKGFRSRIDREDWIGQARDLEHRRGRRTH